MYTSLIIKIALAIAAVAALVWLNIEWDDPVKTPSLRKLIHGVDLVVAVVLLGVIAKYGLWC